MYEDEDFEGFNLEFDKKEIEDSLKEDVFKFDGTCKRCGEELENEDLQGECIECGCMCCYACGEMQEEGLKCEECKRLEV